MPSATSRTLHRSGPRRRELGFGVSSTWLATCSNGPWTSTTAMSRRSWSRCALLTAPAARPPTGGGGSDRVARGGDFGLALQFSAPPVRFDSRGRSVSTWAIRAFAVPALQANGRALRTDRIAAPQPHHRFGSGLVHDPAIGVRGPERVVEVVVVAAHPERRRHALIGQEKVADRRRRSRCRRSAPTPATCEGAGSRWCSTRSRLPPGTRSVIAACRMAPDCCRRRSRCRLTVLGDETVGPRVAAPRIDVVVHPAPVRERRVRRTWSTQAENVRTRVNKSGCHQAIENAAAPPRTRAHGASALRVVRKSDRLLGQLRCRGLLGRREKLRVGPLA